LKINGVNKNNTINEQLEENMTMEERHREVVERAVFRSGASAEEIYNAMLPMPEIDIEARIEEIEEDLKEIADEVRKEQIEYVRDSRKLQFEMRQLELFPRVKIRMEMLQKIKKSMVEQKVKKVTEAKRKLEDKEQEAEIAQDNIGLIDSVEVRISALTKKMKTLKRSDPDRTELAKRIQNLNKMKMELGDRVQYEETILEVKNARSAIARYESNSPEDIVIKASEEPWKIVFANMEFEEISRLSEQDIKDKLGVQGEKDKQEYKAEQEERKVREPIKIRTLESSTSESQSLKISEPKEKKISKIGKFLTKIPVTKNIINLANYFRRNKQEQEPLLEAPEELKTEKTEKRKAVMDEAIYSTSKNLIANEAKFREILSQEEFAFYLKLALEREVIEQDRQVAIDTKLPTYRQLINKARKNETMTTAEPKESDITEEQKIERTELRKTVMAEAMKSSSEILKANELELKKVLSQAEYNWYLKEALRREKLEEMRQKAITVQNEQLSKKGIVKVSQGENISQEDSESFSSRRDSLIGRLRTDVGSGVHDAVQTRAGRSKEGEGERIA